MLGTLGYNSYFSTKQAGLGKYMSSVLASILYKMDKFNVTVDNLRSVANAGGAGHISDAPMYSSNHIFLDGSTQSVDYVTVSGSDYVYFDVTTKVHISGTAVGATTNITASHSNFTSLKGGASVVTADKTYLDANPEAIARLVDGETVAGLSFDLTDIEAFYPTNEGEASGEFVQDVMTDLGSDVYANTYSPNTSYFTYTSITDGFNVVGTTSIDENQSWLAGFDLSITSHSGEIYAFEFNAVVNSGIYTITSYYNGSVYVSRGYEHVIVTGPNTILVPARNVDATRMAISSTYIGVAFNIDITNITIKELTGYSEITNYASACRTNLDLTNYGASNLLYKQDATGRWLGMADANLIEFTGDGRYVDTGLMPPSDSPWEIDFVIYIEANGAYELSGITPSLGVGKISFGKDNLDKAFFEIGDKTTSILASVGYHHLRVEFDGVGGGNFVLDNTTVVAYSNSTYTYLTTESFFLGGRSRLKAFYDIPVKTPVGYFQYTTKTRTSEERDADYAKAKVNHPTLP